VRRPLLGSGRRGQARRSPDQGRRLDRADVPDGRGPAVPPGGPPGPPGARDCRRPAGGPLRAAGAAAIEGLTRGLAVELAPVRVNAVRPGAVHTPMWDAAPEPQRSALLGALAERTITKTGGEPDQIAAAHLYLTDNP